MPQTFPIPGRLRYILRAFQQIKSEGYLASAFPGKGVLFHIEYVFIRVHSAKGEQFQFAMLTLLTIFILTVGEAAGFIARRIGHYSGDNSAAANRTQLAATYQ